MHIKNQNNAPRTTDRGFTLIELSIVLVIIGLVIGGVMVGRDLIKSSQIRSQISEIEKVNTSILTFKLKYNALPGDITSPNNFFPSGSQPAQLKAGNADGIIQGYCNRSTTCNDATINSTWPADQWAEWVSVYDYLAAAGLSSFPQYDETTSNNPASVPELKFSTTGGTSDAALAVYNPRMAVGYEPAYLHIPAGHKIVIGACPQCGAGGSGGINPWDAYAIDSKIDDGKPHTGASIIVGAFYNYRVYGSASDSTSYCGIYATNTYYNESNIVIGGGGLPRVRTCRMHIRANF